MWVGKGDFHLGKENCTFVKGSGLDNLYERRNHSKPKALFHSPCDQPKYTHLQQYHPSLLTNIHLTASFLLFFSLLLQFSPSLLPFPSTTNTPSHLPHHDEFSQKTHSRPILALSAQTGHFRTLPPHPSAVIIPLRFKECKGVGKGMRKRKGNRKGKVQNKRKEIDR